MVEALQTLASRGLTREVMIAVRSGDRDNWSNVLVDLPREAREYLLERCVTNYTEASNTLFEKLTKHGVLQLKLHVKTDGQDQNDHFTSFSSSSLPSPPSLFSMTHVTSVKGVEHLDISFSSSHFSILAMFASLSPPPRRPAPSLAHSITSLNASHCEDITDGVVNIISKYFTSLLHLNISACSVTAKGILNISSPETNTRSQLQSLNVSHNVASIEAVYNLKDITSLTALNISCLRQVYSMEEYTNLVWSNLKEFRMGGLVCLESLDIAQTIANSIHSLRSLELGECSLRSSDLEYAMSTAFHGTNAEESELCVEKKSSYTCTPLHLLNLSWCDDLSSKAIFSVLIRSPGIRSLILQKTCILCEHVKLIANACPLLEELNLALCSDISNDAIMSLSHLSHLHVINIAWSLVQDDGVLRLLEFCPLRILILQGCKELTEYVIDSIINSESPDKMNLDLIDMTMVDCCEATKAKKMSASLHEKCIVVDYYQSSYKSGQLIEEYFTGITENGFFVDSVN